MFLFFDAIPLGTAPGPAPPRAVQAGRRVDHTPAVTAVRLTPPVTSVLLP